MAANNTTTIGLTGPDETEITFCWSIGSHWYLIRCVTPRKNSIVLFEPSRTVSTVVVHMHWLSDELTVHMHWLSRALHYLLVLLLPRFSSRRQLEERLAKVVVPMITYIVPYILVIHINWLVHMHWLAVSKHWVSMHVYDDCMYNTILFSLFLRYRTANKKIRMLVNTYTV